MKEHINEISIDQRLLGIHSINPFIIHNSSPRSVMTGSHLSQHLTLKNGERRIVFTGADKELAKYTIKKQIKNQSKVIAVIPRGAGPIEGTSEKIPEITIVFHDLEQNILDYITVPTYNSYSSYFGFEFNRDDNYLSDLCNGDIIEKNTILADSPSKLPDEGYGIGMNPNCVFMSHEAVGEDAIAVSESYCENKTIDIYEKRELTIRKDEYFANLYGTKDFYKPLPNKGEHIHSTGLLCVKKKHDSIFNPVYLSKKGIMDYDLGFDEPTYVRGPKGIVEDLKVYKSVISKTEPLTNTTDFLDLHAKDLLDYYQNLIDAYTRANDEYVKKYKSEITVSPSLTRLLVEAQGNLKSVDVSGENGRVKKTFKKDELGLYRIEIVVKYTLPLEVGLKLSDTHGGKGVIVVLPDSEMPIAKDGTKADIILHDGSTSSRMNTGRLFEHYFCSASRKLKKIVTDIYKIDSKVEEEIYHALKSLPLEKLQVGFKEVVDFLSLVENKQHETYKKAMNNKQAILSVLTQVIHKEAYLLYSGDDGDFAPEVSMRIKQSRFRPFKDRIYVRENGELVETKDEFLIGPLHHIMLAKIADTWLATSCSKVNHYGLPINSTKVDKHQDAHRNNAVKGISESEARLFLSYAGVVALAELKDRNTSIATHTHNYNTLLNHPTPTNIDEIVDRTKMPYGDDKALELLQNLYSSAGMSIEYQERTI